MRDLATFSISQEAAMDILEGRLGDAVKALDDCNAANAKLAAEKITGG